MSIKLTVLYHQYREFIHLSAVEIYLITSDIRLTFYSKLCKYNHSIPFKSCEYVAGYNSDSSEEMIPSPQSYMSYSPGTADNQQAMSPEYRPCSSPQISSLDELQSPQSWCTDSSAFFWTQLQKEEIILNNMSDAELLATDEYGRK